MPIGVVAEFAKNFVELLFFHPEAKLVVSSATVADNLGNFINTGTVIQSLERARRVLQHKIPPKGGVSIEKRMVLR